MTPKGDYNLGVYNPPTSLDSLRFSEQISGDLALRLNNLQAGKETGYQQKVETFLPKFLQPDEELINYINNLSLETIINMIRQGWKDTEETLNTPSPSPSPSPTPNSSPSTPGAFPPGSLPLSGGNTSCTVIVSREYKRWIFYEGSTDYGHWISRGSVRVDEEGYKYLSGNYEFITPPSPPVPFFDVYPDWQTLSKYDYFSYGGLYGASGPENEVYKEINRTCGYYFNDGGQAVATTYTVIYSNCPLTDTEKPDSPPSRRYGGLSSPPPPPRLGRKKMCCDCNTIASIMEAQFLGQIKLFELLKDHIDQRIKEEINIHQKQLEALDFEDALKVILDRVNKTESNLWNGIEQ